MEERNGWWVSVISLGMVSYGVGAIRVLYLNYGHLLLDVSMWLPAVLMIVVGAVALFCEIVRQPEDRSNTRFSLLLSPYVLAWQRLLRTKWLLWVYGTIFVIVAVGDTLGSGLAFLWLRRAEPGSLASAFAQTFPEQLWHAVWSSLPAWAMQSLSKFFPSTGRGGWDVIFGAVVLILAISIVPTVVRLRGDPARAGKVGFFSFCLAVLALGSVLMSARWATEVAGYRTWSNPPAVRASLPVSGRSGAKWLPSGTFGGRRVRPTGAQMVTNGLGSIAMGTILGAMLFGGILGSLARARKGEEIIGSAFVSDAVKTFEPLAGVFAICAIPGVVSFLSYAPHMQAFSYINSVVGPVVAPLLMFASLAVVVKGASCVDAIRQSARMWVTKPWDTLSLVATGSFLLALMNAPIWVFMRELGKWSWWYVALEPLWALVSVGSSALILLAVWEFYQANAIDREPASAVESGPLP